MLFCLLKVFLEWCISVRGVLKVRLLFCSHASTYVFGLSDMQVFMDFLLCKEMGPNKLIIILLEYFLKALKTLVWKNI